MVIIFCYFCSFYDIKCLCEFSCEWKLKKSNVQSSQSATFSFNKPIVGNKNTGCWLSTFVDSTFIISKCVASTLVVSTLVVLTFSDSTLVGPTSILSSCVVWTFSDSMLVISTFCNSALIGSSLIISTWVGLTTSSSCRPENKLNLFFGNFEETEINFKWLFFSITKAFSRHWYEYYMIYPINFWSELKATF